MLASILRILEELLTSFSVFFSSFQFFLVGIFLEGHVISSYFLYCFIILCDCTDTHKYNTVKAANSWRCVEGFIHFYFIYQNLFIVGVYFALQPQ